MILPCDLFWGALHLCGGWLCMHAHGCNTHTTSTLSALRLLCHNGAGTGGVSTRELTTTTTTLYPYKVCTGLAVCGRYLLCRCPPACTCVYARVVYSLNWITAIGVRVVVVVLFTASALQHGSNAGTVRCSAVHTRAPQMYVATPVGVCGCCARNWW